MKIDGVIRKADGNRLLIELDRPVKIIDERVQVDVDDGKSVTPDQRKKIFALIRDMSKYTGYYTTEIAASWKFAYLATTGQDYFSLSNCDRKTASDYLHWLLDFCFNHQIPFATKDWDSLPSDYPWARKCLENRLCTICGKPQADIDHFFHSVGMGRKRLLINHSESYFMSLCRTHHTERHELGAQSFMNKYHIKPVKLDDETIEKLKIKHK